MDRRQFLAASAIAGAVPFLPADDKKDAPKMLPVIDTHQHLWDLAKFKLNWLKKGSEFDQSFTPKEYTAAIEGLNVVKSVYMEVDVIPEQQLAEAEYVTELCESKKTTMVAAVISGRPADTNFASYLAKFKDSKYVKGVRQVLHVDDTPSGYSLKDEFVKGVQLLGDLGMSFDLCMRPTDLRDAAKLLDKCPDTRCILDHCGNPNAKFTAKQFDQWKADLAEVAKRKNVMVKVSGIIANGWEKGKWKAEDLAPAVNATIDTFGVNRCMYGGDWPVCTIAATYKEWLTALRQIIADRPEADQKKILHDNAAKFYGI
jgi:predicted TIM-barrel fold metal-dependent hydrolase